METCESCASDHEAAMFIDYLWGMETLKQRNLYNMKEGFIDYLWGMETDFHAVVWERSVFVYRLPMRDGNYSVPSIGIAVSVFIDYLWGMETRNV